MRDDISFSDLFTPFTKTKATIYIFLIGFLLFFNSFFNGFVGDDLPQILDNTPIHSISNVASFFSGSTFAGTNQKIGVYYKPLLSTTFSCIYTFFGPQAFFFHMVQVMFVCLNASLVFVIFTHFFKKDLSFVLALIFLVHPINSEVALYISAMQDVLFFFFGSSALLILISAKTKKQAGLVILFLGCSLLSKETGVVFLGLTILYSMLFKRSYLFPVFLGSFTTFVIYLLLRYHAIGLLTKPLSSPIDQLPLIQRMMHIPAMLFYYLKTSIFPIHLSFSHQWAHAKIDFTNFYFPLFILCLFLTTLGMSYLYIKKSTQGKYHKQFLFFTGVFFLGIILHLQIFPLDVTVAERWFYVPLFGLLGIIGTLFSVYKIKYTKMLTISIVLLLVILATRTFIRTFDWRDDLTLSLHDSIAFPDDYNLQNGIAFGLMQKGEFKKAVPYAKQSVALYPFWNNYNTLGVAYANVGEYKKAHDAYDKGIAIMPHYLLFENKAALTMVTGKPKENIQILQKTLKKFPNSGKIWMYLGIAQYKDNDPKAAQKSLETAYYYYQGAEVISIYQTIQQGKPLILNH